MVPSTNAPGLVPPNQQSPLFDRFTAQTPQQPETTPSTGVELEPAPPAPTNTVIVAPIIETWHERSARIPAGKLGGDLAPWRK